MGEVLIVVAIIVVLAGVGFVALISHLRNMNQLELDGHAKEIFVAAQNHLSMAKSQDYLGVAEYQTTDGVTTRTDNFGFVENGESDDGIYYIIVNNASAIDKGASLFEQILPFASVSETARAKGSYIIRYQKDPAQILDVFYVSPTGRYKHTFGNTREEYSEVTGLADYYDIDGKFVDNKGARRNHDFVAGTTDKGVVVGWYGGGVAGVPAGEKLKTPGLEIINGDKLEVRVTDYNGTSNDGNQLVLLINSGETSHKIQLIGTGAGSDKRVTNNGSTYTVVLDDVTTESGVSDDFHFKKLNGAFSAGSNIEVLAIAYNNEVITNIAETPAQETNSLFASLEGTTVEISSIRHLLNLDSSVSGLSVNVNTAKQISDLNWADFKANTRGEATQIFTVISTESNPIKYSEAGSYMPVSPAISSYEGQAGSNRITGIVVTDESKSIGNAGLFSTLSCNVSDLELIDFKITSKSGNAGALAGATSGSPVITAVLVHNSKTGGQKISAPGEDEQYATAGADLAEGMMIESTTAAAGGLVGGMNGGTVNMCAAAVYVKGATEAGGLIGSASGGSVTSCYSGGHTEDAKYQAAKDTTAGNNTTVNVIAGTNAGGLIGNASGTTVSYSYSTASAAGATVGGLVGYASSGSVNNCYAVGLVVPDATGKASSLVGDGSMDFTGNNYYLEGVSDQADNSGYASLSSYVHGISAGTENAAFIVTDQKQAFTYDKKLVVDYGKTVNGKTVVGYYFPTIAQLVGSSFDTGATGGLKTFRESFLTKHYGDWQLPVHSPLNYMLINGDTLDLIVELKENTTSTTYVTLAVTGESSGVTRLFKLGLSLSSGSWTVTSAKEYAVDAADNVSSYSEGADVSSLFANRISIFKFTNTNYAYHPQSGFSYPPSYTGDKREVKKNGAGTGEYVYDVKITLDDITKTGTHFAQLLANKHVYGKDADDKDITIDLIPGENITVRVAGGDVDWAELKEIAATQDDMSEINAYAKANSIPWEYNPLSSADNSLFSAYNKDTNNADIANFRHLMNLDEDISEVSGVKKATLLRNLNWTGVAPADGADADPPEVANDPNVTKGTYFSKITNTEDKSVSGTFYGIYNSKLTSFDGKEHYIRNLTVDATKTNYSTLSSTANTNAGLFRLIETETAKTTDTIEIKNLHLVDPIVKSASGAAGGLVAEVKATNAAKLSLSKVRVEGFGTDIAITSSSGAAGGLIGKSAESVDIDNSAASVTVAAVGGAAGGLVGSQSAGELKITNSYAAGQTENGAYTWMSGNTMQGNWSKNISSSVAAGGLVGEFKGSKLHIDHTFSTAAVSLSGTAVSKAGGLIGNLEGSLEMELVYTVAPVKGVRMGDEENKNGALVGTRKDGVTVSATKVFFLPDVYSNFDGYSYTGTVGSKVCSVRTVGSGVQIPGVDFAAYSREKKPAGGYTACADIIAVNDTVSASDPIETTTKIYDSTLVTTIRNGENLVTSDLEFPFAIWTNFGTSSKDVHFYGDWQPSQNKDSATFNFYFLKYTPASGDLSASVEVLSNAIQMPVQLDPFDEDTMLSIPTLPYLMGFAYGNDDIADSNEFVDPEPVEDSTSPYVWTMYYVTNDTSFDASHPENYLSAGTRPEGSAGASRYTAIGNAVKLKRADLNAAFDETAKGGTILMVAHYDALETQIFLTTMDLNDDGTAYEPVGSVQTFDKITGLTFADLYEGTPDPDDPDVVDNKITLLRRSRPGKRFVGWAQGDTLIYKYEKNNGFTPTDAASTEIDSAHIVLKAVYTDIVTNDVTLHFLRKGSSAVLTAPYKLSYEQGDTFKINVPMPSGMVADKIRSSPYELDENNVVNDSEAKIDNSVIKINYNGEDQHKHYYIFVDSDTTKVDYYVRYELEQTKLQDIYVNQESSVTLTNLSDMTEYTPSGAFILDPDNGAARQADENAIPDAAEFIRTIPGYNVNGSSQKTRTIECTESNYQYYRVPKEKIGSYIVVVDYVRDEPLLTFVTDYNGEPGDYIPPEYVAVGTLLRTKLGTDNYKPAHTGYIFDGWKWEDADGKSGEIAVTQLSTTNLPMPAVAMTLTAQWKDDDADFTVLVWAESAEHLGTYELKADVVLQAKSNTAVSVTSNETNSGLTLTVCGKTVPADSLGDFKDEIMFFHYKDFDCQTTSVQGDGSTLVNVYLDRNYYTLRFYYGFMRNMKSSSNYKLGEQYPEGKHYYKQNNTYIELSKDENGWYYLRNANDPNSKTRVADNETYVYGFIPDNDAQYCVSNQSNSTSNGGFDGFFSQSVYPVNAAHLEARGSDGKYLYNAMDVTVGGSKYIVYYTDLTAKYGTVIADKWPREPNYSSGNTNYTFIGWHVKEQSILLNTHYYPTTKTSSIKTYYETMSSDIICMTPSTTSSTKTAIRAEDGVAHTLRCRYSTAQRHYIYRWYKMKTPKPNLTGSAFNEYMKNLTANDYEVSYFVAGSQASEPRKQIPGDFIGYIGGEDYMYIVQNPGDNPVDGTKRYYEKQATPGSSFNGYSVRYDGTTYDQNDKAMLMNYYYWPKEHTATFYNGVQASGTVGSAINTYYGDDLLAKTQNCFVEKYKELKQAQENYLKYYDFGGWYDDPYCSEGHLIASITDSDVTSNSSTVTVNMHGTTTIPVGDGDLKYYAKMTHKKVQVTFDLNYDGPTPGTGDFYSFEWDWGKTLEEKAALEGADAAYRNLTRDGYTFKGWYDKADDTGKRFSFSRKIGDDYKDMAVTIYAHWEKNEETAATVTVYYILDENETVPGQSNDLTDYTALLTPTQEDKTWWKQTVSQVNGNSLAAGKSYQELAPTADSAGWQDRLSGYYPVLIKRSCVLQGGNDNTLVFVYHKPATWYYQVQYYVKYTNDDATASAWSISNVDSGSREVPLGAPFTPERDKDGTTEEFVLVGYEPDQNAPWLKYYKLDPDGDPYVLVERQDHTSPTAPFTVNVYLVPDSDAIDIPDRVVTYNGTSQIEDYHEIEFTSPNQEITMPDGSVVKSPLWFNAADTKITVHYLYYDMTDMSIGKELTATTDAVNAGTYGVRAYITAEVGDETYMIWHSEDEGDKPPLHLYIEKRIAFLSSAISSGDPVYTDHDVFYEGGSDPAQAKITNIISFLTRSGVSADDIGFVYLEKDGTVLVDDRPQQADYIFAACAFRQMSGTSPNIFSFKPASADRQALYRQNYNIYYFYGTVSVP